ncbi:MAG: hypothetical protein CG440_438 [Methanosaeta sp. NSM2]|nr:MAG: hypothetical protein CG440_438 [Methanosaeta sp. NSM2]
MNALSLVFVAMHQLYALRQENNGVKGLEKNIAKTDLKKKRETAIAFALSNYFPSRRSDIQARRVELKSTKIPVILSASKYP